MKLGGWLFAIACWLPVLLATLLWCLGIAIHLFSGGWPHWVETEPCLTVRCYGSHNPILVALPVAGICILAMPLVIFLARPINRSVLLRRIAPYIAGIVLLVLAWHFGFRIKIDPCE